MRDTKHRNTEQHQERNSVNIEITCVYFPHAYMLNSKRGGGRQQDFINVRSRHSHSFVSTGYVTAISLDKMSCKQPLPVTSCQSL